jgi:hypothetical protein
MKEHWEKGSRDKSTEGITGCNGSRFLAKGSRSSSICRLSRAFRVNPGTDHRDDRCSRVDDCSEEELSLLLIR